MWNFTVISDAADITVSGACSWEVHACRATAAQLKGLPH